jgi:hypothetical protein
MAGQTDRGAARGGALRLAAVTAALSRPMVVD